MPRRPDGASSFSSPDQQAEMEALLSVVETHLEGLGLALRERDPQAIDLQAGQLHRALVQAIDVFSLAARQGPIPQPLRMRLARASGQVAIQRECLARATAALDRAIDAILPGAAGSGVYTAQGRTSVQAGGGGIRV